MSDRILGPTAEPTLADLVNKIKRETALSINCVQIGTIESYNPLLNTAQVSINFKKRIPDGSEIDYPVLADCPVIVLTGGTASISFPITKGDTCLILFNDKNIDDWWFSGNVVVPADSRTHSISDGIILVGLRGLTKASLTPTGSICINGGTKKVAIKNAVTDMKTQLDDLCTNVNAIIDTTKNAITKINALIDAIVQITVTCAAPGAPSTAPLNAAAITAMKVDFSAYNTSLGTTKTAISGVKTQLDLLLDVGAT